MKESRNANTSAGTWELSSSSLMRKRVQNVIALLAAAMLALVAWQISRLVNRFLRGSRWAFGWFNTERTTGRQVAMARWTSKPRPRSVKLAPRPCRFV